MPRNNELHPQSTLIQQLAEFIKTKATTQNISTQNIADIIKRAYSYTYNRIHGKAAFSLDDLNEIAPLLGYKNIFDFMREFEKHIKYNTIKHKTDNQTKK